MMRELLAKLEAEQVHATDRWLIGWEPSHDRHPFGCFTQPTGLPLAEDQGGS